MKFTVFEAAGLSGQRQTVFFRGLAVILGSLQGDACSKPRQKLRANLCTEDAVFYNTLLADGRRNVVSKPRTRCNEWEAGSIQQQTCCDGDEAIVFLGSSTHCCASTHG